MKVLLADDSMTAQNMGKKILADAGFEVIAVSNGAQAMKKIASEKPALLVLDVFMPGYSGIEVCEKVKNSADAVPVLLTVSKLEPFKPEEATKAKADGLIIKPFEATDLVTAVQKLVAKATPAPEPAPAYERTVKLAPIVSDEEWKAAPEAEPEPQAATQRVAVPQEMADAPAFDLGEPAPAVEQAPPAMWDATATPSAPSFFTTEPAPTPEFFAAPEPAADTAVIEPPSELEAALAAAAASSPADWEPTIAPPVEVAVSPIVGFEPTIDTSSASVSTYQDPALATAPSDINAFATKFDGASQEPVPVGFAADFGGAAAAPALAPEPVSEISVEPPQQFAPQLMATESAPEAAVAVVPEPEPAPDPLLQQMHDAVANMPVETAPVEEHVVAEPVAVVEPAPAPAAPHADVQFAAELAAAITNAPVATPEHHETPSDLGPGAPALNIDPVARAVERVLDRFKAELIAEIMRELK